MDCCFFATILSALLVAVTCLNGEHNNDNKSRLFSEPNLVELIDSLKSDPRIRPNYSGNPVEVQVSMYISYMAYVSEISMDFSLSMYLRQYWTDPRLSFETIDGVDDICLYSGDQKNIWTPNTFFFNKKEITKYDGNMFIRISPSGHVVQSEGISIVATCAMDMKYFPMDSQFCTLIVECYGHNDNELYYRWKEDTAVVMNAGVQLPHFEIVGYRKKSYVEFLSTGNYSRLSVEFMFSRSLGYYMMQFFLPPAMVVVISWFSFWLSRDNLIERAGMGVTSVLTMSYLMTNANENMPKVSYVKAIDIYMMTCFLMVFLSLLETVCVSYIDKLHRHGGRSKAMPIQESAETLISAIMHLSSSRYPDKEDKKGSNNSNVLSGYDDWAKKATNPQTPAPPGPEAETAESSSSSSSSSCFVVGGAAIDKVSRVFFPCLFLAMQTGYWWLYLTVSDVTPEDLIRYEL